MAVISSYNAARRLVTLETSLAALPVTGDGYAITAAPSTVLKDSARSVDFLSLVSGSSAGALTCSCAGSDFASLTLCAASSAACAAGGCTCALALGAGAPQEDGMLTGETLFLTDGSGGAAAVTAHNGATPTATVAVSGSAEGEYGRELASSATIATGASYVVTASYLAQARLYATTRRARGSRSRFAGPLASGPRRRSPVSRR
mmetsp:Transcript_43411/g.87124  ORF Transcript_43411/g.87124 Transcript_43411/m.87124 type:complete len:204 (+) Transcript_43411:278-889(+)